MNNTGPHSLNNRIHGECRALSEQDPEHRSEDWWLMFHKEMAVRFDGYPTDNYKVKRHKKVIRIPVPRSLAKVSDAKMMDVQMEIQVTADEKGLWLWEYRKQNETDHLIYRSINGRTYDEMQEYVRDIRENMVPAAEKKDPAEAQRLRDRADELSVTRQSRYSAKIDLEQRAEGEKKDEKKQPEIW